MPCRRRMQRPRPGFGADRRLARSPTLHPARFVCILELRHGESLSPLNLDRSGAHA